MLSTNNYTALRRIMTINTTTTTYNYVNRFIHSNGLNTLLLNQTNNTSLSVSSKITRSVELNNCFSLRSSSTSTRADPSVWKNHKYEYITTETRSDNVALITLNRPKALNALCDGLINDLNHALRSIDVDSSIGCIVITGSERAFAAGADIKEMLPNTYPNTFSNDMLAHWHDLTKIKKPIIAAVNGYALGGGCELALMCDIILASQTAKFGHTCILSIEPEVTIGTIPGCGGSQRLTRAVGKSKAMEMILTGESITADEAKQYNLVSRVVPSSELIDNAVSLGNKIASYSQPIIQMAKEAVNAAYDTTLQQGVLFERRLFHSTFGTQDQKHGMTSFTKKQKPQWTNN